jgi:hypothetical protein
MACPSCVVNALLNTLRARGARAVRCGRFIGVQGDGVGRLPPSIWQILAACEMELLLILPNEPRPFQTWRSRS